jgi:colanic acid biosynthesis protein WcaH
MKGNTDLIPEELYKEIHKNVPIACVDILVEHDGKFLMTKRTNAPAKGEWWFPGGRVLKNETLLDAAKRKLKEETGLVAEDMKILGVDETFFPDGPFGGDTHTINIVFLAEVSDISSFVLDTQSSEAKWFDTIDEMWNPYLKKFAMFAKQEETKRQ